MKYKIKKITDYPERKRRLFDRPKLMLIMRFAIQICAKDWSYGEYLKSSRIFVLLKK